MRTFGSRRGGALRLIHQGSLVGLVFYKPFEGKISHDRSKNGE